MREKQIENKLKKEIEKLGGICFKFTSPNNDGVPDRLILINGYTIFVELKAPGKKPRPLQRKQIKRIQRQGIPVYIISTIKEVENFIKKDVSYFLDNNQKWFVYQKEQTKLKCSGNWNKCNQYVLNKIPKEGTFEANGRYFNITKDNKIINQFIIEKIKKD